MKGININNLPSKVLQFISYYFTSKHVPDHINENGGGGAPANSIVNDERFIKQSLIEKMKSNLIHHDAALDGDYFFTHLDEFYEEQKQQMREDT